MTLTGRINTEQSFSILTDETDKVYMHGKWVKARDLVVDGRVPALDGAEIVPALKDTFVEKGELAWAAGDMARWQSTSIFGLTARYLDPATPGTDAYAQALQEFPLILLDDDGQEMADFILVSDHKIVLLHAKAIGSNTGGTGAAVTSNSGSWPTGCSVARLLPDIFTADRGRSMVKALCSQLDYYPHATHRIDPHFPQSQRRGHGRYRLGGPHRTARSPHQQGSLASRRSTGRYRCGADKGPKHESQ